MFCSMRRWQSKWNDPFFIKEKYYILTIAQMKTFTVYLIVYKIKNVIFSVYWKCNRHQRSNWRCCPFVQCLDSLILKDFRITLISLISINGLIIWQHVACIIEFRIIFVYAYTHKWFDQVTTRDLITLDLCKAVDILI